MRHREAWLRQNQQGSLFQAQGRRRSNPLSYRASSPEVFLIPGRSKSFGHRPPSVLDVARSFRIARNRLWPRWQRARSQGGCLSWVNLLWVTSHFSVSSEPLPTPDDKSAHRQTVVGSGERRCYPIPSPRKFTSSRFTSSAWVQVMQCGPSFTTNKRAPLISLAVRSPEALIGRIRSASPLMTNVGTSTRLRSLRKSSYHVRTQARQAVAEAPAATFQLDCTGCSLTRFRSRRSVL